VKRRNRELGAKIRRKMGLGRVKENKNLGGEMKGTGSSEEGMEGAGS
jgi:hypothetical protein